MEAQISAKIKGRFHEQDRITPAHKGCVEQKPLSHVAAGRQRVTGAEWGFWSLYTIASFKNNSYKLRKSDLNGIWKRTSVTEILGNLLRKCSVGKDWPSNLHHTFTYISKTLKTIKNSNMDEIYLWCALLDTVSTWQMLWRYKIVKFKPFWK